MSLDTLHKEIDLIQSIINRMASNSFLLKGWSVSLVAVILALSKDSLISGNHALVLFIVLLPVLSFWYLDAYFLRQERMYRELYKWVISKRPNDMQLQYDLNAKRFEKNVQSEFRIMLSKTLVVFYGIPLVFIISIIIFTFIKK